MAEKHPDLLEKAGTILSRILGRDAEAKVELDTLPTPLFDALARLESSDPSTTDATLQELIAFISSPDGADARFALQNLGIGQEEFMRLAQNPDAPHEDDAIKHLMQTAASAMQGNFTKGEQAGKGVTKAALRSRFGGTQPIRNDPSKKIKEGGLCWCGSGIKYKKCCRNKNEEKAQ